MSIKRALLTAPLILGQSNAFCDFKEVKFTYYTNSDCGTIDLDATDMAKSAYSEVINNMNNCYEVDGYHLKALCDE